jgi:multiple sugar transport system permease protein
MRRPAMSKREKARLLEDFAFISPQLVLYLCLVILPLLVAVPILFTDRNTYMDNNVQNIGLGNFTRIFSDSTLRGEFWPALQRSVRFTAINFVMIFVFGLTLALLMYEIGFKGTFFTIIFLPMMVSGLAMGFLASMLFSRSTGTMNILLQNLGWIQEPVDIKLAGGTTIILPILIGWQYAGFNMAIFLAGLLGIPRETIEASIVDGASYLQRLLWIYIPQMVPSIIIASTFCLIGSFGVFDQLIALGAMFGNKEAELLAVLFFQYGFARQRFALGITLSMLTGIPLLVLGLLLQRVQKRLQYEQ